MGIITVKAIIPFEVFAAIYAALPHSAKCAAVWCEFSRTTCHVREAREACREWWHEVNGSAPGFSNYEIVFQTAIATPGFENSLYWCFYTDQMRPVEETYAMLVAELRDSFAGQYRT